MLTFIVPFAGNARVVVGKNWSEREWEACLGRLMELLELEGEGEGEGKVIGEIWVLVGETGEGMDEDAYAGL